MSEKTKEIDDLLIECHAAAVRAGWWHDLETGEPITRNRGECLCLIHSEISEGCVAERQGAMDDKLPHRIGAEVELADALTRIADYAGGFGRALEIGEADWVCDWAGLHARVSTVMEYERKRRPRSAEIALSWLATHIVSYANSRGFDIWAAMREKLAFNAQRSDHKPENRRKAGGKEW